jgi:hypothetical protein
VQCSTVQYNVGLATSRRPRAKRILPLRCIFAMSRKTGQGRVSSGHGMFLLGVGLQDEEAKEMSWMHAYKADGGERRYSSSCADRSE